MSDLPLKVLYIDIETAPAKAYIWDLKTRYVPLRQVEEDGYVLCFAYRWGHENEIGFWSRWDQGEKNMVKAAWQLMDEADVIIHYNGDNFDVPRLNTEFLRYRLGPPSPAHSIDLYKVVNGTFRVLSKSMNHMLHLLGLESKMEHKGMELWTGCMRGVEEDQLTMEEYNVQDVNVMQELYRELRPWIRNHPNVALWMDRSEEPKCPKCGSDNLRFKGYKRTKVLSYRQYKCNDCGSYSRQRRADDTGKMRRDDVLTW